MRPVLTLITVVWLAAGVAACGGSGASGATGTSAKASASEFLQFSKCMRAHGVPSFPDPPDPSAGGGIRIGPGSGLNPRSPAFQAAQKTCRPRLPGGGPGAIKATKAQYAEGLSFARCMRSHGQPNFPDPVASVPAGSGPIISLHGMMFKPGPGINLGSPAFRQAASDCGVRMPMPPG